MKGLIQKSGYIKPGSGDENSAQQLSLAGHLPR